MEEIRKQAAREVQPEAFAIFKNALIYSVCAQIVSNVVGVQEPSSLVVLILVFAIIVKLLTAVAIELNIASKMYASNMAVHLFVFISSACLNVAVQFESTLIARVAVSILSPASDHVVWVTVLAFMSLTLLWLLNESVLAVR
jgi:hypothetical protein